ncbi:MAG: bifunctional folylpolyglutamate synthase/dihydrofolate synthase [Oscillospiraceae bacterium]
MDSIKEHMKFINSFSKKGGKVSDLSRIEKLMNAIGNPQDCLEFIHIAGTNGKGSMAQMFSEILIDAGYKVGLFTSPYIIEYNDRIRINDSNISNEDLKRISDKIDPIVMSLDCCKDFSQFEITQAIAMTYFVEEKCDIVVLEAGVGGLLDSTNIIKHPLVSVIGSIALDHIAVLGETIEKIAFQKAGIIKPECPCVLSAGNPMEAVNVIRHKAIENHSQLVIPNLMLCRAYKWDISGCEFSYKGQEYSLAMGGLHQISNAITVIEAIKYPAEKLEITTQNVINGLKKAVLPGRIEIIKRRPLTILDGGHNPDGTKALAKALETVKQSPKIAVIGMNNDKNIVDAIKNLIPIIDKFICVDGYYPMAADKNMLKECIISLGGNAEISDLSICEQIEKVQKSNADGLTLICGSLFLASAVKKIYDNKTKGD